MRNYRILQTAFTLFVIIITAGCTTSTGKGNTSGTAKNMAGRNYTTTVTGDSGDHTELAGKAAVLAAQGKAESALEHYTLAIWLAPDIPAYYAGRAAVYEDLNQLESAYDDYVNAISLSADDLPYLARKAHIAFALQRFQIADTDAARVIAFSQTLPEKERISLLSIRAESLAHLGNLQDACLVAETLCTLGECSYRQNCK